MNEWKWWQWYSDITKELSKVTGKLQSEIAFLFEDMQTEVFNYDDELIIEAGYEPKSIKNISPSMKQTINAAIKKTTTEAINLTKTTAITSQNLYISACDLAHMQITSGAFSYQEAIKNAVKHAARQGVSVIYKSGWVSELAVAIRRSALTGINQTAGKLQTMRAEELNVDIMELTAHYGARPDHAEWQGQLVSLSGKEGYLTRDDIGYGAVDGFMGANCRHNWNMFFEGISTRNYTDEELKQLANETVSYNGKEMLVSQGRDMQRSIERGIKTTKRELVMLDEGIKNATDNEVKERLQNEFNRSAVKLKGQEARLSDFCRQTGLKRDRFREQVFAAETENGIKNWSKSASQKAVWANKKELDKIAESGIIKSGAISGARNPYGEKAQKHADQYYESVRAMKTDVAHIAKTTGYSEQEIQNVKNFIFYEKHNLGGVKPERFAPDFMMSESWQRLINGTPEPHDLTLIKHEIMEQQLIKQGFDQATAHIKTSERYNYSKEASEFYDNIKKYKD